MPQESFMISEFAYLSGIPRKTLIFYDQIGLLRPEYTTENGYRHYSYRQLETASVISALRETGMPLKEIKDYLDQRNPDNFIRLFTRQRDNVTQKIEYLRNVRDMIDFRLDAAQRSKHIHMDEIVLQRRPSECLLLGPPVPEIETLRESWYYLADFYEYCYRRGVAYGLPAGALLRNHELLAGNWYNPAHYYYRLPEREHAQGNASTPAGWYLTGWAYADYGKTAPLYEKLFAYAQANAITLTGDAYEEFLLDEITVARPEQYLMEISIQVMPANGDSP